MQAFGARMYPVKPNGEGVGRSVSLFYFLILSARALRKWINIFLIILSLKVYFKSETQEDGFYP